MSRWCPNTILLLIATGCTLAQTAKLAILKDSVQEDRVPVVSLRGGEEQFQIRAFRASASMPSGKSEAFQLATIYDATNGLFWWKYEMINPSVGNTFLSRFRRQAKLVASSDRIVSFSFGSSPTLFVRESKGHATSLDDAVSKTSTAFGSQLPAIANGSAEPAQRIDLVPGLGADFFNKPNQDFTQNMASILSVSSEGNGGWALIIEGPLGNRAKISLDSHYQLVGTALIKN